MTQYSNTGKPLKIPESEISRMITAGICPVAVDGCRRLNAVARITDPGGGSGAAIGDESEADDDEPEPKHSDDPEPVTATRSVLHRSGVTMRRKLSKAAERALILAAQEFDSCDYVGVAIDDSTQVSHPHLILT